ncbi:MAG: carbohydrate ABC transporter permease [Armatimonadota bacterium]|nr:carbohydrate ABC transporter permease [Armatimonadota bacterium]
MPIIPVVGRRGWKLRLVLFLLYLVVAAGALTVVYPFALMVSSGFTSAVDFDDMRVLPKYFTDDGLLHRKYVAEKYNSGIRADGMINWALQELSDRYGEELYTARDIGGWHAQNAKGKYTKAPRFNGRDPKIRRRVDDYNEFRKTLSPNYFNLCLLGGPMLPGEPFHAFGELMEKRYRNIDALNNAYGDTFTSFYPGSLLGSSPGPGMDILLRPDWWASGSIDEKLNTGKLDEPVLLRQMDWYAFKARTKPEWRQTLAGRFDYQRLLLKRIDLAPEDGEKVTIPALRKTYGIVATKLREVPLPGSVPLNPAEAEAWEEFVRTMWSARYLRATGGQDLFVDHLRRRYGTIEKVNKAWRTSFSSFDAPDLFPIELPAYLPVHEAEVGGIETLPTVDSVRKFRKLAHRELTPKFQRTIEWATFVKTKLPIQHIQIIDSEQLYREFLAKKYGSLDGINRAQGLGARSLETIFPPYRETDFIEVFDQHRQLRWIYATRNFKAVFNYLALKGRAALNTLILVLMTVGTHLTVTPMAAFVLSRFRLPYTYKVLLFLIATMAFPGDVAALPSFLMLKHLHLFNTYWALVLPGLANGFGIFILKSFFDSLPEELFEAARIDGAGELRQLWNVAIPLIKPILAINALGSFTAAYGGFMWAYLVCRKEEMWTLMVYLFQFSMGGDSSMMMAALVLASIPTLLIFVFCQQIILRGIILPQFK